VFGGDRAPGLQQGVRVVAIIVTWNRSRDAIALIEDVRAEREDPGFGGTLDLVVVDNASGTEHANALIETCGPAVRLANTSIDPARPVFSNDPSPADGAPGAWITLVRNRANLGGCGGFLTGMALATLGRSDEQAPDAIWLLDDDVRLEPGVLGRLASRLRGHERLGIVGARMADPDDHARTLESTVHFNRDTGFFGPEPEAGREGAGPINGAPALVRVDVVAASCLLARTDAVREAGMWDPRFFLAGDDAEWCLRIARAGWTIGVDLDATHYHKPWHTKKNPRREYCRKRNLLWIWARHLPRRRARRLAASRIRAWLGQGLTQIRRGKLVEAHLSIRAPLDAARSRAGGPPEPIAGRFVRARLVALWVWALVRCALWLALVRDRGLAPVVASREGDARA